MKDLSVPIRAMLDMLEYDCVEVIPADMLDEDVRVGANGMLAGQIGGRKYWFDDEAMAWRIAGSKVGAAAKASREDQNRLNAMAVSNPQAKEILQALAQDNEKVGKDITGAERAVAANPRLAKSRLIGEPIAGEPAPEMEPPVIQPQGGMRSDEFDAEWYKSYMSKIEEWNEAGYLERAPQTISKIFSGYWAKLDFGPGRDFVAVVPTNRITIDTMQYKGVYVFRKNAHQAFPDFGIDEGEDFELYIPSLARGHRTRLLGEEGIRKNAEKLGLGRFLRRDFHQLNTTGNLEQFESFEDAIAYTDLGPESLDHSKSPISESHCPHCHQLLRKGR